MGYKKDDHVPLGLGNYQLIKIGVCFKYSPRISTPLIQLFGGIPCGVLLILFACCANNPVPCRRYISLLVCNLTLDMCDVVC